MLVKNQCKYSKCSWFMISMPKMLCLWIYDDKSNPYLSGKSGKKAFYIYIKNSGKKAISVMFMILLKCHSTNALLWGSYLMRVEVSNWLVSSLQSILLGTYLSQGFDMDYIVLNWKASIYSSFDGHVSMWFWLSQPLYIKKDC